MTKIFNFERNYFALICTYFSKTPKTYFNKIKFLNMVGNKDTGLTEHEAELYDRQIRLWGLEAQKRLRESKILIAGLSGLGAEVAKNIILAGVKSVTLLDHRNVTAEDQCSQFFAPFSSIGQNRAEASVKRARALNPMVEIIVDQEPLSEKKENYYTNFDVVIIIGSSNEELLKINNICRSNNVKFFCSDVWGVFGYSFADLQIHEFVEDKVKHKVISKPHEKVKTELVTAAVKRKLEFPSFQKLIDFDFTTPQYTKRMKKVGTALPLLKILQEFRSRHQRDPNFKIREDDITELKKIRDEIAQNLVSDTEFETVFAQISPVAAIIGGELAQETIKTVSKKEAPNLNVFLFDHKNCSGFIEVIE